MSGSREPFSLGEAFVRPRYDQTSFLALPGSIAGLLGRAPRAGLAEGLVSSFGTEFDRVLLLLADGFGWRFFGRYLDHPALRRFIRDGVAWKLSAQFPSTTAAQITTLHTGLPVGEHGVFEWQYYEPQVDALIAPMMFSYAGTRTRDELAKEKVDARSLLPAMTIYQDLAGLGIRADIFQHREYTPSTYSDILFGGARVTPYATFPEALTELRTAILDPWAPDYLVCYFDKLDFMGHHHGPSSPHFEAEADLFLVALEREFFKKLRASGRTLVMLTADHGMVDTDPSDAIYLNVDKSFAGVERYLRRNGRGQLLVPAGSPRDLFLYVHRELLDEAQTFLAARLEGRAQVARVSDLITAGFFGPEPPSSTFLQRVGNLVVLPYGGECVWWYEEGRHEQRFFGHHGGLTPQEMEIPLLATVV